MSNAVLPTACREVKLWQINSFHRLAQIKVLHLNRRMAPAAKGFTPRSGCSPGGCRRRGKATQPSLDPSLCTGSSLPSALQCWAHSLCPSGSLGGTGWHWGFWGVALGFCPPCSPQLCTLGGCLRCISCVSKPPSCPRNSHNLLCVFLAQKRLIHSLKQINYFCYLEKKKKKKKNPLGLVGLTFNCVHNAVKQICSEPEQKSSQNKKLGVTVFTWHVSSGLCNLGSICVFFLTYMTNGANLSLPWRWNGEQMFLFPDTFYNLFPFWFVSCWCGSRLPE